jgi:CHRD domain
MIFLKRYITFLTVASVSLLLLGGLVFSTFALATHASNGSSNGSSHEELRAGLNGFQQVPSILSNGRGTFTATINKGSISYTLTYSGLSSTATVSHIHFAQRGVNSVPFVFLCGGGGKPACPPDGGTVTGTITAADILAIPDQGLAAGDFAGAVRAIESGNTYVNVHTTLFPAGEIRGQIQSND